MRSRDIRAHHEWSAEKLRYLRHKFLRRVWKWCRPTGYAGVRKLQQRMQANGLYSENTHEKDVRHGIVFHWWKVFGLPHHHGCHWRDISIARNRWVIYNGFGFVNHQWAKQRNIA